MTTRSPSQRCAPRSVGGCHRHGPPPCANVCHGQLRDFTGSSFTINCGPSGGGNVWGSNPYTDDSSLRRAVAHACGTHRPISARIVDLGCASSYSTSPARTALLRIPLAIGAMPIRLCAADPARPQVIQVCATARGTDVCVCRHSCLWQLLTRIIVRQLAWPTRGRHMDDVQPNERDLQF